MDTKKAMLRLTARSEMGIEGDWFRKSSPKAGINQGMFYQAPYT